MIDYFGLPIFSISLLGNADTSDPMTDVLVLLAAVGFMDASSATLCMALPTVSTEIARPRLNKRLKGDKIDPAIDSPSRGRVRDSTVSKNPG
jgi:hypothetical protein